ncbi:MAG: hypothetical protein K9L30_02570 [Desulfobacterales bacterium]|nr:hypothetical protein [Desulfobacterales bacterium]
MTNHELELFKKLAAQLETDITLDLVFSDDGPPDEIQAFCDQITEDGSGITVNRKKDETALLPGIKIHDRLIFNTAPTGTEFEPFLEAIRLSDGKAAGLSDDEQYQLEKVDTPCILRLFVSSHCPFCPQMALKLIPLTFISENTRLSVIDAMMFQTHSQESAIQSVPTLLLDNDFRWTGNVSTSEIVGIMVGRDPFALSADSIGSLIKEGRAVDVAQMMIERKAVFPGFLKLLIDEKWSTRLGAMVTMESIIEYDMALALAGLNSLLDNFMEINDRAQGDLLYLFGLCGNRETIQYIKGLLTRLSSDELKEAAAETITDIGGRL